jgi:hypothetical protein
MRHRALFLAGLTSILLTAVMSATALAGGWASAVMDAPPDGPVRPDEPVTVGFTLLQHGETPVDWGETRLAAINDTTGQEVVVDARLQGSAGHWAATIRLPDGGTWRYEVRHELLITPVGFVPVSVIASGTDVPTTTGPVQPALVAAIALLVALLVSALVAGTLVLRRSRLPRVRAYR